MASYLRTALRQFITGDRLFGSSAILPGLRWHMSLVNGMVTSTQPDVQAQFGDLFVLYAEFASWLFENLGITSSASYWIGRALDFTEQSGHSSLVSYLLGRQAEIESYDLHTHGNSSVRAKVANRVVGLARSAQDRPDATPPVRAYAQQLEAYAHALAGNERESMIRLDGASKLSEQNGPNEIFEPADFCTPEYIELARASCWAELGQHRRAIDGFEHALLTWPALFHRERGLLLARLARAHAEAGSVDAAVAVAMQAMQVAENMGSNRILIELLRLRGCLNRWRRTPEVSSFVQTVDTAIRSFE